MEVYKLKSRKYFRKYVLFALIILGFTQPLTEMSTRNIKIMMFLGSKVRPERRADNLTDICEPTV
jgi:hypothetical protein